MKILCVCSRGNSRSVALAWILKDHLHLDALAMGIDTNSEETKNVLYDWADRIILVDKIFEERIPKEYKTKLKIFDVGGDRFFRGFEPELLQIYINYINKEGL